MKRCHRRNAASCLILILVSLLLPRSSRAADLGWKKGLNASATFGPIGSITASFVDLDVMVNGRVARGWTQLFNGDAIETFSKTSVRVSLESTASLSLGSNSRVGLSISRRSDAGAMSRTLVLTYTSGDVGISLQGGADAYVEGAGLALAVSREAIFRISDDRRGALGIEVERGVVIDLDQTARIAARAVRRTRGGVIVEARKGPLKTKGGKRNEVATQWKENYAKETSRSAYGAPRYVAARSARSQSVDVLTGRTVDFKLDPPNLGSLDASSGVTDSDGVVTVSFTAGTTVKHGSVIAEMAPTADDISAGTIFEPFVKEVFVNIAPSNWKRNLSIAAAAVAASVFFLKPDPKRQRALARGQISIR